MFLVAQIFSGIGAALLLYSTFSNTKEKMLTIQIFDSAFNAIADAILGGWAGVMLNVVSIARNITTTKGKMNNVLLAGLLGITLVISLCFNKSGLLPLVASVEYTIVVSKCDLFKSKVALAVNLSLWLFYDISLRSYPIAIADAVILISTIVSIARMSKEHGNERAISLDFEKKN